MASSTLFVALLRPAVLHILRAAGFHGARAAAADTLVDIAYRYMILVAEKTAEYAQNNDEDGPSVTALRMALEEVGALGPVITGSEEQMYFDDDLRGIQTLTSWLEGDVHKEIRRIAGLVATSGEVNLELDGVREDYLTALKKKHSKTGEESRFQGTALGKPAADKQIKIEGWDEEIMSLGAWHDKQKRKFDQIETTIPQLYEVSAESSPLSDA